MSVLRIMWAWFDDRTGIGELLGPMLTHPVPKGTNWWYVFGSATLIAFILQVVTGVALAFVYVPSAGEAYQSLQYITNVAPFGRILRGIHYFGASAMVLFVGIHMIRVFLFGAYKYPREVSWLSGVLLLGLTVGMGFTGQLLRWDQNAIWSVIVGAEQAARAPVIGKWVAHAFIGGRTIGSETLSRFFTFHVFVLPALIFGIVGLHLYLVIRNGISEPPKAGVPVNPATYRRDYENLLKKEGRPFWPDAAWRDAVFGLLVVLAVVGLAAWFGPPVLDNPPDPTVIKANPHPDWYLMWYFAVLALLPPGIEDYFMVYVPMAAGLVLILLPFFFKGGERHPARRPWAVASVLLIVMMIGTLWIEARRQPWSPVFDAKPVPATVVAGNDAAVQHGREVFNAKGCLYCHTIAGHGGLRGPNLTTVGDRLTKDDIVLRILNGGTNMPAFAMMLKPDELDDVVAFLQSRKAYPAPPEVAASDKANAEK